MPPGIKRPRMKPRHLLSTRSKKLEAGEILVITTVPPAWEGKMKVGDMVEYIKTIGKTAIVKEWIRTGWLKPPYGTSLQFGYPRAALNRISQDQAKKQLG